MEKFKRSSGILVKNKDKILLCKRSPDKNFGNEWSIPMGKIEKNEKPIECAYREFYEETNLKINEPINLIGFLKKISKDKKTRNGIVFIYQYETKNNFFIPDLENASDGHEHTECKYFKIDNLPISKKNKNLISIIKNSN